MTKEERRIYQKEYNKNSESYKKYQKSWREKNKEYFKKYRENRKSYYIYMFLDNVEIVYIGKTNNMDFRMSHHKSTREYYEDGYTVLYKEFANINDAILEDIEAMLIEAIRPIKNTKINDYDASVLNWTYCFY